MKPPRTRFLPSCASAVLSLAALLLLIRGGFCPASFAAANYSVQRWEAGGEAGLPQNTVTAVVQTHEGYLWLGTYSGLARFDGVRFTVFADNTASGLASSRVTSLFEADDGTLWIGHETGDVSRYQAGRFETVPFASVPSDGKIQDLGADENGDVWAMNAEGTIIRLRDGLKLIPETGAAGNMIVFARSARGSIWIARNGRVSALRRGQLVPLQFGEADNNQLVAGIGAAGDGALWVAADGKIRKRVDAGWTDERSMPGEGGLIVRLIETRKGDLLAATSDQGCYLIPPGAGIIQFKRATGFPSDWVTCLCEDREGNIWAGTGGAGLVALRTAIFKTMSPPDQWQGRAVLCTCPTRDGALWVGTEGAGLYRWQDGVWANFSVTAGLRNPYVWSVAEDSRDGLWVGTWNGGLLLRRGDFFDRVDGTNSGPHITAILCSERGGLWVGTGVGLMRYEGGRVTWHGVSQNMNRTDVRSVAEAADGTVWFGMSGGGLGCLKPDGQLCYYRQADGLASDYVGCLRLENDGTLWIGTLGGGLTRLKNGNFASINRRQGLPNSFICHIEDDGRGSYWMSSHGGVLRVNKAELNRCADGRTGEVFCRTFGLGDGLPTLKCSDGLQPAGCRTADGSLWFSTSRGLVTVDPQDLLTNTLAPPVLIERVQLDDDVMLLDSGATRELRIPPGPHRFEITFTALSFVASDQLHFKYRLRNQSSDWVSLGPKRTVNFNYLPPGTYGFEITACNSDGVWNEAGARLAFTVLPFFWQTLWFRATAGGLLLAGAAGAVWFETRRRMRRKLQILERQQAIEGERSRIAKDIHDDLGSTLTRITMLSDPTRGEADETSLLAGNIRQIHQTARELTHSMDEIVWAINPQHDTLDSLVNYLEKYAQDFLSTARMRCRLDVPLQFPVVHLSAETRHNLFLAFKEALHNVVKHSGAAQVRVTLELQPAAFALAVEDDGHGFVMSNVKNSGSVRAMGGNGLANMQRRLEKIGGVCEIQSSPGLGTKVIFTMPIPLLCDQ